MTQELSRMIRFLAVGLMNTGFSYINYSVLVLLGLPLWLAVSGSMAFAFVFNFLTYGRLIFQKTSLRLLPRFILFYGGLGMLNVVALRALARLGLGPLLGQALLVPAIALVGFFGMKSFVFGTAFGGEPSERA